MKSFVYKDVLVGEHVATLLVLTVYSNPVSTHIILTSYCSLHESALIRVPLQIN